MCLAFALNINGFTNPPGFQLDEMNEHTASMKSIKLASNMLTIAMSSKSFIASFFF